MDVAITELEKIEATRVDGVETPANGIPILLLKAAAPDVAKAGHAPMTGTHSHPHPANGSQDGDGEHSHEHSHDGDADHGHSHAEKSVFDRDAAVAAVKAIVGRKVDETPDIAGGTAVLAQIADLIIAEAQELKAGNAGEIADIFELACAAEKIWCWRTGEEAVGSGSVMPATTLMQSAADGTFPAFISKAVNDWTPEMITAFAAEWDKLVTQGRAPELAKSGPSAEERRQAASEGNALPDGSYPIRNAHELNSAAILARSGHGDVAAAKRLIARRAKELGVKNPLEDDGDTSKSQIAEGGTDVDTVTQGTGDLEQVVEAAVTKALAASEERVKALEAELAKVKALPVPGGPLMTRVQAPKAEDGEDHAAKAAKYDLLAEQLADPVTADEYRKLAAQHRAKITV